MKQKLIFLDIDGTLLPPGEMTVPASAVEAIRQARANGHKVFLCTGRNLRRRSRCLPTVSMALSALQAAM